jgi:NAD(P)-dependent dehydrogenase (short-subunit alcohol dehydrogenase family)
LARVVITGGETGLGLSLVRAYTDAGDRVSVLCRASTPELDALGPEIHPGIDITNAAAVYRAAAEMGDVPIDILINNAGIMIDDDIESLDVGSVRLQFEVNALGPLNIALAFRKRLRRNSKLVNISSRLGSVGDNESGGDFGYRMSKAAQNMLTSNLAIDLGEEGIVVVAAHPGIVASNMTGGKGTPSNEVARDLRATIEQLTADATGRFIDRFGKELPW